jgi:hypothetical protein
MGAEDQAAGGVDAWTLSRTIRGIGLDSLGRPRDYADTAVGSAREGPVSLLLLALVVGGAVGIVS